MAKTIARKDFTTPKELADAVTDLMFKAPGDWRDVNLDMEGSVARLVEVTLTDGSKVYNIEIGAE